MGKAVISSVKWQGNSMKVTEVLVVHGWGITGESELCKVLRV